MARARPADGGLPSALAGRTFWSTSVTEHGAPGPMPADARITLRFSTNAELEAVGGCLALLGHADTSDGRIALSVWARTWREGADEPGRAVGRWLAALLESRPSWQLSGTHLRISAGGTVIELTDRPHDRPLEGTRWAGRAIIGGRVRGSIARLGQVYLVFDRGRVTGSDGCQPLSAPAIVSGETIDFGAGPDVADGAIGGDLAQHVRATLHGTVRYKNDAGQLILSGADADGFGVGLLLAAVRRRNVTAPGPRQTPAR
jgi:heat shock protein HslJ